MGRLRMSWIAPTVSAATSTTIEELEPGERGGKHYGKPQLASVAADRA